MGLADVIGLHTRSSTFLCTVVVHELASVPLVTATMRLKWKFKHVSANILSAEGAGEGSGLGEEVISRFLHPLSTQIQPGIKSSSRFDSHVRTASEDSAGDFPISPVDSPVASPVLDPRTPNPDRTPNANHQHSTFSSPFGSPVGSPSSFGTGQEFPNPRSLEQSFDSGEYRQRSRAHAISPDGPLLPHALPRAEAKGATNLVALRNYTATFRREIHCAVAIPLRPSPSTSKYQLQPCPLRLAIRQEVIEDGGKKLEVKTGEVLLDLSQFVNQKGKEGAGVTRRYLLQDCKTNATLRVTVKMQWIAGETAFIAPPLKSGQIQAALTVTQTVSNSNGRSSPSKPRKSSTASLLSREGVARSNSSSSISQTSSPAKSLESRQTKRQGWRPPSNSTSHSSSHTSNFSTPTTEHSATDIIDSIFNRPAGRSLWGFTHQAPRARTPSGGSTNGNGRRNVPNIAIDIPGANSRSVSSSSSRNAFVAHSAPASTLSSPQFLTPTARKTSDASARSRSVRFGTDEAPPPPPTLRSGMVNGSNGMKESPSTQSLRGLENVGEEDERGSGVLAEDLSRQLTIKASDRKAEMYPVQSTPPPSALSLQSMFGKKRSVSAPPSKIDWVSSFS